MVTWSVIGGSALVGRIVQVWVLGSNPGAGTSRLGAVEAGMANWMLSGPGLALAASIASRSVNWLGTWTSEVVVTRKFARSTRLSTPSSLGQKDRGLVRLAGRNRRSRPFLIVLDLHPMRRRGRQTSRRSIPVACWNVVGEVPR